LEDSETNWFLTAVALSVSILLVMCSRNLVTLGGLLSNTDDLSCSQHRKIVRAVATAASFTNRLLID